MNAVADRPRGRTLMAKVEATLPGVPVCGVATYLWQELEPMEVTMTVAIGFGRPITWHFARDLLDTAFSAFDTADGGQFHGQGDVMLKLERDRIHYWLASDNGQRRSIYTSAAKVMDLVKASLNIVPASAETTAVDQAIEKILGGTA